MDFKAKGDLLNDRVFFQLRVLADEVADAKVVEVGIAKAPAGVQRQSFVALVVTEINADLELDARD